MGLEDGVEFFEVLPVEGDHRLGLQHSFAEPILVQRGNGPQELGLSTDPIRSDGIRSSWI